MCVPSKTLSSFFFETRSYYVAQSGLELVILLPKTLGSRIISLYHHPWFLILWLDPQCSSVRRWGCRRCVGRRTHGLSHHTKGFLELTGSLFFCSALFPSWEEAVRRLGPEAGTLILAFPASRAVRNTWRGMAICHSSTVTAKGFAWLTAVSTKLCREGLRLHLEFLCPNLGISCAPFRGAGDLKGARVCTAFGEQQLLSLFLGLLRQS
jgi:hypothetical protein